MSLDWIKEEREGVFVIDADTAYPELLAELKASIADLPEPDGATELPWLTELRNLDLDNLSQYWVEVVYQMAKLEVRRMLLLAGGNAWPNMIKVVGAKEDDGNGNILSKWALSRFPVGRGIEAATKGREAREHYKRLRSFIPN